MKGNEWALVVAFAATLVGISFVSPDAAVMLGGFVGIVMLVESGALQHITSLIGENTP